MLAKDAIINSISNQFFERAEKDGVNLNFKETHAINFLVKKLIEFNLWDKFVAIYPFVGRSAVTHSYNLKNILRHTIRWFNTGSLKHDEKGVTNFYNGYGNTFVAPGIFEDNNIHISVYNASFYPFLNPFSPVLGSSTPSSDYRYRHMHTIWLKYPYRDTQSTYSCGAKGQTFPITTASAGEDAGDFLHSQVYGYIVGVNSNRCFLNGKQFGFNPSGPISVTERINTSRNDPIRGLVYNWTQYPFMIFTNRAFGRTEDAVRYRIPRTNNFENYTAFANANIRLVTIGYALTSEENKTLYDIVEEFQAILGRNVGELKIEPDVFKVIEHGTKFDLKVKNLKIVKAFFNEDHVEHGIYPYLNIKSLKVTGPRRVYTDDSIGFGASVLSFQEIS